MFSSTRDLRTRRTRRLPSRRSDRKSLDRRPIVFVSIKVTRKDGLLRLSIEDGKKLSPDEIDLFRRIEATRDKIAIETKREEDFKKPQEASDPIVIIVRNDAPAQFLEELTRTLKPVPSDHTKSSSRSMANKSPPPSLSSQTTPLSPPSAVSKGLKISLAKKFVFLSSSCDTF
jgi:hypothetical protein